MFRDIVGPQTFGGGAAGPRHFQDKNDDLSVNWLEYFGTRDMEKNIDSIRTAFRAKNYSLRRNGRFAVLNVRIAKAAIEASCSRSLRFEHDPKEDDLSHSAIRGYSGRDLIVATELAALAKERTLYAAVV